MPLDLAALDGRGRVVLAGARVPAALLRDGSPPGAALDRDGAALVDLVLDGAAVAAVLPAGSPCDGPCVTLGGRHVWPMLVDAHAHLDKAHTVDRAPDSGGTHPGARAATTADRLAHWRHDDLVRRMAFGLACAEAHGVAAIRTHLDSHEGQSEETWGALAAVRGTTPVALQAVALVPIDAYRGPYGVRLADLVAAHGGLLGGVTRASGGTHGQGLDDLDDLLDILFRLARERDLDVDLHVDEAAEAGALPHVARATVRHGWEGRVTCGHCCSLALLPDPDPVIAAVADAGISIVTLPTVNMYLQDRTPGRTPRWRGVTPVHELRAAGVRVAVAGDNCRDPFYAYGDHDMLDTFRAAVRVLHLDHPAGDAVAMAGPVPAAMLGLDAGTIAPGARADLMVLEAWRLDQVIARPQSDRRLLRAGRAIDGTPPSYARLEAANADPDGAAHAGAEDTCRT